jgi:hypothetical protein
MGYIETIVYTGYFAREYFDKNEQKSCPVILRPILDL